MKKCQLEAMFNNAKDLQKTIVFKRALDNFDGGIIVYKKCDLITLDFALTYLLESKDYIVKEFAQQEN